MTVDLGALLRGERIDVPASGWSMWPAIQDGDVVSVRPVSHRALKCGDVVLSVSGGKLVLHRVTHVGQHIVTQGDTMPYPDAALRPVEVLGIAVSAKRSGRRYQISTLRWRSQRGARALRSALRFALSLRDRLRGR